MSEKSTRITAAIGLVVGALLGLLGSFAPSDSLRALAWGIDGVALVLAGALLTIYYFRKGEDGTAAGFLVFAIGEALILSSSGINLDDHLTAFGAGTSLWSVALFLISFQKTFRLPFRCTGALAATLFAILSVMIFTGGRVNALTRPLPFFIYPVFVITLLGWAWTLLTQEHDTNVKS